MKDVFQQINPNPTSRNSIPPGVVARCDRSVCVDVRRGIKWRISQAVQTFVGWGVKDEVRLRRHG